MRHERWITAGVAIIGAATLALGVRGADANEAPPTVTVYKSPT